MKQKEFAESKHIEFLRKIAMSLPEVAEGPSCNKRAFSVRKKNFLFLGLKEASYSIMLKVRDSAGEIAKLAKKDPDKYGVSAQGWAKVVYDVDEAPLKGALERWIVESYSLMAPKSMLASLADSPPKKKVAKKKP